MTHRFSSSYYRTSFLAVLLTLTALLAACGLSFALLVQSAGWALPGFVLVGAGFSSIIPLVFAAGGRIRAMSEGAGVAAVSGIQQLAPALIARGQIDRCAGPWSVHWRR